MDKAPTLSSADQRRQSLMTVAKLRVIADCPETTYLIKLLPVQVSTPPSGFRRRLSAHALVGIHRMFF